jgi:hypothetical protein
MKRVLTTVHAAHVRRRTAGVVFAPRPAAAADDEHMARMLKMMEQMNAQMNQMQQQYGADEADARRDGADEADAEQNARHDAGASRGNAEGVSWRRRSRYPKKGG